MHTRFFYFNQFFNELHHPKIAKTSQKTLVNSNFAVDVKDAIIQLLNPIKSVENTIIFDNGKEFALPQLIDKGLDYQSYFTKPYYSWYEYKRRMQMDFYDNNSQNRLN